VLTTDHTDLIDEMRKPTNVEIVIPVHNRCETTLQALRSLSRIDSTNLNIHVIIVDDGSTDGTSDALRAEFPVVQIVLGDGTLQYAAGTNQGIREALTHAPDFLVLCNDDSIFHEQFLKRMFVTATANPRSVIGAILLLWNEPHLVFQVDFEWKTLKGGWQQADRHSLFDLPSEPFGVEGLAGNCVLVPVAAIKETGLMDEVKFPHGWGDIQYFTRMRKAGWSLLVDPRAYVWCEPNTNPAPLHSRTVREAFSILFSDRQHPLNLQRQFIARWESAPSKYSAIAASAVYLTQLTWKSVKYVLKR
jgi:GT2 family glycosyltransferase